MDSIKKIIVSHRSAHHSEYSGYAQLIKYLQSDHLIEGEPAIPYRLAKLLSKWYSKDAGLYDSNSVYKNAELKRLIKNLTTPTVVHFLNAERDIRILKKKSNVAYCASFHKPPSLLKQQMPNSKYLEQLKGAICVGENQVNFITEWLGLNQVSYIPHGIDTSFFIPADGEKKIDRPNLLFVGQHLRDFETFNSVVKTLLEKIPDLTVDVVLRKEYQKKILQHKRVVIHSGISDMQLLAFYQKATLMFLPLLDATACNSILEALACGLPIVTSDVGGVRGYLNGTRNKLCVRGDVDCYLANIQSLIFDDTGHQILKHENIEHAKRFYWEVIVRQIDVFYQNLIN